MAPAAPTRSDDLKELFALMQQLRLDADVLGELETSSSDTEDRRGQDDPVLIEDDFVRASVRFRGIEDDAFPTYLEIASDELRKAVIREWQEMMETGNVKPVASSIVRVHAADLELNLLRNDDLPEHVLPTTCNFNLTIKHRMPKFSLANWLYYGHDELPDDVRSAFDESTEFERLLISRARASKISFRFSELHRRDNGPGGSKSILTEQRFVKGNVVVIPQDVTHLNDVLPPSTDVLRDTTQPSKETIARLNPVLVRKSRVRKLIQFLIENNIHYAPSPEFHGLSQHNLDMLFGADKVHVDQDVPCAMDIGFLQDCAASSSDGYVPEAEAIPEADEADGLIMENVGYTNGDQTPQTYRQMKMKALSHCLTGGKFLKSQAGSRFVPDFKNPRLLSWLFPHLDPWGIGGFFEPARNVYLTMEDQVSYLLEVDGSRFASDADFAFVYYNILQKKAVCDSVTFTVRASQQQRIMQRLMSVDVSVLQRLIEKYEKDAQYQPQNDAEREVLNLLREVGMIGKDLPGTNAYKRAMRNEIRALIYHHGTPTLFVTLNPSDVHHPLVRLLAGDDIDINQIEVGEELTEWQRKVLAARNPSACARFFHTMDVDCLANARPTTAL
ncbi:hypothetical protein FKP32DRAFT_1600664 [Trametes sanguinea]|nr:hypothetical protein FKP32DRAFT_1600664 [Trametes sanguinea]